MRRALIALIAVVVAFVELGAAATAGGNRSARSVTPVARLVTLPAGISLRVPAGWQVVHGWLSDVVDPAPRLAVASFPVRLSRSPCACGFPNVVRFPRNGAFVFTWEYLHPQRRQLARMPGRPARFSLSASGGVRQTCYGPTAEADFKDAGRVFQVEIYIGPTAGRALRVQVAGMLDTLHVARVGDA